MPHSHPCSEHLTLLTVKNLITSLNNFGYQSTADEPATESSNTIHVSDKIRRWFHIQESIPNPPLYLQNAQWLI